MNKIRYDDARYILEVLRVGFNQEIDNLSQAQSKHRHAEKLYRTQLRVVEELSLLEIQEFGNPNVG